MASLYEIDQAILDTIDPETGEIVDIEKLSELQMQREAKIENVALWVKNLKAEASAYKAEKDAFAEREKVAKAKIENLSEWLTGALNGERSRSQILTRFLKVHCGNNHGIAGQDHDQR